jgi:cytochrome c oxidase subunit 4
MSNPNDNGGGEDQEVYALDKPATTPSAAYGTPHPGHHGGPDHVPHVLPLWVYLATWGALMVLTVITVAVSYVDIGGFNLVIALLVATIKATIVAMMFMHLKYDHKFHAIIFSFSIIFLGIFIAFTMFDTETRGQADAVQADRSRDVKAPFKGPALDGKKEAELKTKLGIPADQPLQPAQLEPPK